MQKEVSKKCSETDPVIPASCPRPRHPLCSMSLVFWLFRGEFDRLSMRNIISLVLGGGRGTRLYPLTKYRAKPAVPLAAKYRLIDIPLSNCINSGINQIYVLTQFLSVSLHRHLRQTYRFDQFSGGFVELLAAQQTDGGNEQVDWYQGTADAVRKNVRYLEQSDADYVLILSGDQLYRMDYGDLLKSHTNANADVTIAALPVDREQARSFGVMRIDESGRVHGFLEKPQTDKEMDIVRMEPTRKPCTRPDSSIRMTP